MYLQTGPCPTSLDSLCEIYKTFKVYSTKQNVFREDIAAGVRNIPIALCPFFHFPIGDFFEILKNFPKYPTLVIFRSGRISSVYIVGGLLLLWVTLLSKIVNFEFVGMC